MRKTFNISANVEQELVKHAKDNGTTQGKVVEVALALYLSMYKSALTMAETFDSMKLKGQTDIFESLQKK
jgi:hypothetical protein